MGKELEMKMNDGKEEFDNTMCLCCIHVFEHRRPILLAWRDDKITDNMLEPVEYMCGEDDHYSSKDARIVGFWHLADYDPTILPPRSIPPGQTFSRLSIHEAWKEEI